MQIQVWIQGKVTSSEVGVLFTSRMLLPSICVPRVQFSFSDTATERTAMWTKGHWPTLCGSCSQTFCPLTRMGVLPPQQQGSIQFSKLNEWPLSRGGVAFRALFNSKTEGSSSRCLSQWVSYGQESSLHCIPRAEHSAWYTVGAPTPDCLRGRKEQGASAQTGRPTKSNSGLIQFKRSEIKS